MPNRRRQQQARAPSGQQPTGGLQLETVVAAQSIFEEDVMRPALEAPEGLARLEAVCAAYLSYVERQVFPGGCFFASVLAEMDARSGPIHDLVRSGQRAWMDGLAELARQAQRHGELADDADVEQLAFELQACLELANYHFVLFGDPQELERGRRRCPESCSGTSGRVLRSRHGGWGDPSTQLRSSRRRGDGA